MRKLAFVFLLPFLFSGCASVPMESAPQSQLAKQFNPPSNGKAGLYIYRLGAFGGGDSGFQHTHDLWVDGKCIGASAPGVFFYEEVPGDMGHIISTESIFAPNHLLIHTKSGRNYFVRQYMTSAAYLELVDEARGRAKVEKLEMATKGNCRSIGVTDVYASDPNLQQLLIVPDANDAARSPYFQDKFAQYKDARERYQSYLADAAVQQRAILALQRDVIAARNRYDQEWREVLAQFDSGTVSKHEAEERLKEIHARLERSKQTVADTRKSVNAQREQVRQAMQVERELSMVAAKTLTRMIVAEKTPLQMSSYLRPELDKEFLKQKLKEVTMDEEQTGQIENQWDSHVAAQKQVLSDLYDSDKGKGTPTLTSQQRERSNEDFTPSRNQNMSNDQQVQPEAAAQQRQESKNVGSKTIESFPNASPRTKARKEQKIVANNKQLLEKNKKVVQGGIMEVEKRLESHFDQADQDLKNLYDADKDKEARRQQERSARALEF